MRAIPSAFRSSSVLTENEAALLDQLTAALAPRDPAGIVDVELLLASLDRALELNLDPSAALLRLRADFDIDLPAAQSLSEKLKRYLRQMCAEPIDSVSIGYLAPLAMFARSQGVLDVISLNYDCGVEAIADRERVRLADGFRFFWTPEEEFDQPPDDDSPLIRLYKLHGSISWYRRASYEWVKLPIRPSDSSDILYYTGEQLAEVMVYPTVQKDPGSTPLADLMLRAKAVLRQAAVIVVIGYSFRDERIREAVYEAMARSPTTEIVVVDREADSLVTRWLAAEDMRPRAMPVNATTGEALSGNLLYRITAAIVSAQQQTQVAESQKPHLYGQARRTYRDVIRSYYAIRHIDAVRSVVEREEATNPEPIATSDQHPLPLLSACTAFALVEGSNRSAWWRLLSPLLYWFEADMLRNAASLQTINPRPGVPGIASASANIGFVDGDASAMQGLLKTAVEASGATHSRRREELAALDRQVDRLVELSAIPYSGEPNRRERFDAVVSEYLGTPSPSELAEMLSAPTDSTGQEVAISVEWGGSWPQAAPAFMKTTTDPG